MRLQNYKKKSVGKKKKQKGRRKKIYEKEQKMLSVTSWERFDDGVLLGLT